MVRFMRPRNRRSTSRQTARAAGGFNSRNQPKRILDASDMKIRDRSSHSNRFKSPPASLEPVQAAALWGNRKRGNSS